MGLAQRPLTGLVMSITVAVVALLSGCEAEVKFDGVIGEDCADNLGCRFELHCQERTDTCQVDLAEGEEEPEELGQECVDNHGCPDGLLCQPETDTCQIIADGDGIPGPVLLGGGCAEDAECLDGLACQFASATCQPPGGDDIEGIGASCLTNGDCAGELVCQGESGTCQPVPPPEEG